MARKYTRDNRGRFASSGGGATARGGRLKTAAGNKRATQTMTAKGAGGPAGTIAKGGNGVRGSVARSLAATRKPAAAAAKAAPKPAPMAKARREAEPSGAQINRAYIRAKAIEARNDPRTFAGKNTRRNDKSFGTARKAASFLSKGNSSWQGRARLSTGKAGASKPAAPAKAKAGAVPLNQVRRYNALDRARRRQKETYSREISRVTGSTDRRRADAAMPKADLADRKTRRIEATMRRISNSPNTPNVPVLPRAKKVGEAITGPMSIYGRKTPRTKARAIPNTIRKPRAKPPTPDPATGRRTRGQAKAAQRTRREQILDKGRTGITGLGNMRKNPRIKRNDTGMRQLSLTGGSKTLYKFKRK